MSVAATTRNLRARPGMNAFVTCRDVTELIRDTLASSEIGRRRHSVKLIACAANSNARSAQNWLEGRCAPNLASFINLCRRIPEMKQAALRLLEADDVLDPAFERRFGEAAQAWLDWQAGRK